MGGPSGEDDVSDLTESMTTRTDKKSDAGSGSSNSSPPKGPLSDAPPRPSSPFILLADTSKRASEVSGREKDETKLSLKRENAPSHRFTPSPQSVPVITSPIRKLSNPLPVAQPVAVESPADPDASGEGLMVVEKLDPERAAEEDDEGILDLGQEFIVDTGAGMEEPQQPLSTPEVSKDLEPLPEPSDADADDGAVTSLVLSHLDAEATAEIEASPLPAPSGVEEDVPEKTENPEEEEELDLDGAEELTAVDGAGKEDEEELDLADAVEVPEPPKSRVSAPSPPPVAGSASVSARATKMRRRKGKKEWWAEVFNDDYLTLLPSSSPRDERKEVDFIERSLGVAQGSLVLDLACGDGRHAVGMAKRGYRLVGVDLSLAMLARAGESAQEAGQKINFIHGDMRDLGFVKTFDAVYCIGTSFGYFDEATNLRVLEGVYRALKSGGVFLLEVANRDYVLTEQPNLTWFEGDGSVCMEETDFDYQSSRLHVTRQLILAADARQVRTEASIRLYCLHELGNLLHKVGFKVSMIEGHTAARGAFFGIDSAKLIIVAERGRGA